MTAIDPGDLEVPKWMTLAQAVNILQPRIRNADCRQVLLDAIEAREIEIYQATATPNGVIPLPAHANRHLKPDDMDWANSRVIVNRILYEPGVHAIDAMLPIRISRADFMERFKQLLNSGDRSEPVANGAIRDRPKPRRPKGSSYDKADAEVIELMRPLVQKRGMAPSRAIKTLLTAKQITCSPDEESMIRRVVPKYKEKHCNGK